jgi:hypothetical protein
VGEPRCILRLFARRIDGRRKAHSGVYRNVSRSYAGYVSGYRQRLIETWYETELAYCHKTPDGALYTAHKGAVRAGLALDVDTVYKADRGREIPTWESNHYWIKTGKVY